MAANKKLKTKKGAAKRFKKTGGGFKCKHANSAKKLTKKTTKRKRSLRGLNLVDVADVPEIQQMLPYC